MKNLEFLHSKLTPIKRKILGYINRLTGQEKGLILFLLLLCLFLIGHGLWTDIDSFFNEKNKQFKEIESWRNALPYRITSYLQLSAKKSVLENEYNSLQASLDVRADLEDILKKQKGVQNNFSIKALASEKFADIYEQTSYNVVFSISDYQGLINILKELQEGDKPLIIKAIDIGKSQGGRFLSVKLDLIGLRRINRR